MLEAPLATVTASWVRQIGWGESVNCHLQFSPQMVCSGYMVLLCITIVLLASKTTSKGQVD